MNRATDELSSIIFFIFSFFLFFSRLLFFVAFFFLSFLVKVSAPLFNFRIPFEFLLSSRSLPGMPVGGTRYGRAVRTF